MVALRVRRHDDARLGPDPGRVIAAPFLPRDEVYPDGTSRMSVVIARILALSDRILVMTYRPGKIKRVVDIDLTRPRTSEVVGSDAFGHYVAQIWADLREEASRGMSDDESRARATGTRRK